MWCPYAVGGGHIGITVGKRVGNRIELPQALFDEDIKPKQLADPMMLGDGCEELIQQKILTIMIHANEGRAPSKIGVPMPNSLDQ